MKIFLILITLSFSSHLSAFVPGLLEQGRDMVGLIEEGRKCTISFDESKHVVSFCTGLTLNKNDLQFLRELDLKSCKQFLKQMKYNVYEISKGDTPPKIPKTEIKHFFSSTKLALILHPERAILFKKEAKRGDCIHEVLHFYQRHRPSEVKLNPLRRKEKERRLQFLLENAVTEVEKIEKKGDKNKAAQMAAQLQPFISLQREWKNMISWLDEKEIYQFFFDYPALLTLEKRDIDVALANLVRLKDSLPWKLQERVLFRANLALNKKYKEVPTPQVWKGSTQEEVYNKQFEEGALSREDFEKRVIGLRKFLAKKDHDIASRKHDLFGELNALGRMRAFERPLKVTAKKVKFKGTKVRGLPSITIMGKVFVLDTGAENSSLPPSLLKEFKRKDVLLSNVLRVQSLYGKTDVAPVIQILKPIKIGEVEVRNLTFSVADLKIPGVDGVLGMDFFRSVNEGLWTIDLKSGDFLPFDPTKGVTNSFHLTKNGLANYDALSFVCEGRGGKVKMRLDTGSQIFGDAANSANLLAFESCFGKGLRSKLNIMKKGSLLFTKDVEINIGFPFLKDFSYLSFNLNQGEIFFTKGK